jgi:DNA-binding transcriptional regulator YiaG
MDLDLIYDLANKLDKEAFFEVLDRLKINEFNDKNLLDLLEEYRWKQSLSRTAFSRKIGISKQGYQNWVSSKRVPNNRVLQVASLLGISEKEAYKLNYKK